MSKPILRMHSLCASISSVQLASPFSTILQINHFSSVVSGQACTR